MAISCTAADLAAASKCLCGIASPADRQRVMIYLLQHIAGLDNLTPAELVARAKCLCGIPENRLKAVEVALLCAATGGVPPCPPCPPGGNCTYQDMQVAWTPTNLKLGELIGLSAFQNATAIPGVTALVINWTTNPEGFDIESPTALISLSAPSLVDISGAGYLFLSGAPALTTVSMPMLQTVGAGVSIINNPSLTSLILSALTLVGSGGSNLDLHGNTSLVSLTLPALTTVNSGIGANLLANGCTSLVSVSLPVFSQTNGADVIFTGCALSVASVNHILARCISNAAYVSGTVDLSGQTPAAPPSGQGIADKATLIGRGVTVNTD